MYVIRSDVTRRSRKGLRSTEPDDDQVFVNNSRRGQGDIVLLIVTAQSLAKVDHAALAKARNGLAGSGIQGVQIVHDARKQALAPTLIQIGEPPARTGEMHS